MGLDHKNAPKVKWLLKVLSTLRPDHYFFAKDYRYQGSESHSQQFIHLSKEDTIPEDFFTGLPAGRSKAKAPKIGSRNSVFKIKSAEFKIGNINGAGAPGGLQIIQEVGQLYLSDSSQA